MVFFVSCWEPACADSSDSKWRMQENYMIAECKKANGQYMRTRQDMNLCLANSNGNLRVGNK